MQPADTQSLGIIGAGRIGQAMAQIASRAGRTVVIANRHGPQSLASVVTELGDRVSAGTVPANIWGAQVLAADPHEAGGQRVMFLSGDDADAKSTVRALFEDAGFFVLDLGALREGGRMHQVGGPLSGQNLIRLP